MAQIAVCVIGNGRLDYLEQAVDAMFENVTGVAHLLMVDDSGDSHVARDLARNYPDFQLTAHPTNRGMAAAVNTGFQMVLQTDADYVFWLEEDMRLIYPPPIHQSVIALDANPHVAQMLYQRQPLTPAEEAGGTVLSAMNPHADHGDWAEHTHIFSLNPCLIPRRIVERGWPGGPLGIGNETGMTARLLADGYTFGVWKGRHVEHIGVERAAAWQL